MSDKDILININVPITIEFKHQLEEAFDKVLSSKGFTRAGSGWKENNTAEIYYRQFGRAIDRQKEGE